MTRATAKRAFVTVRLAGLFCFSCSTDCDTDTETNKTLAKDASYDKKNILH